MQFDAAPLLLTLQILDLHLCECKICDLKAHVKYFEKAKKELREKGFGVINFKERLIYRRANKERIAKKVRKSITAETKNGMKEEQWRRLSKNSLLNSERG